MVWYKSKEVNIVGNIKIELNEKEEKSVLELLALGYHITKESGYVQEKCKDYNRAITKVFVL